MAYSHLQFVSLFCSFGISFDLSSNLPFVHSILLLISSFEIFSLVNVILHFKIYICFLFVFLFICGDFNFTKTLYSFVLSIYISAVLNISLVERVLLSIVYPSWLQ